MWTMDTWNDLLMRLPQELWNGREACLKRRGIRDLTMRDLWTVQAIGPGEARTMRSIALRLRVTPGTATAAVDRLVKKAYAVRRRDMEDRRLVLAELTEKGRHVYRIHQEFGETLAENLKRVLRPQDTESLERVLNAVRQFFRDESKEYEEVEYRNTGARKEFAPTSGDERDIM